MKSPACLGRGVCGRNHVAFQGFMAALSRPIQFTAFTLLWHPVLSHFRTLKPYPIPRRKPSPVALNSGVFGAGIW